MKAILFSVIMLVAGAIFSQSSQEVPKNATTIKVEYQGTFENAMRAVAGAIMAKGYSVAQSDAMLGTISTGWQTEGTLYPFTFKISVFVKDVNGKSEITLKGKIKTSRPSYSQNDVIAWRGWKHSEWKQAFSLMNELATYIGDNLTYQ